jgi:hypothetical protein
MEIKYRTQFPELLEHLGLKGDAVECGVAEGRNAQVLIASPNITKLYLIDNWSWLNQAGDGSHPKSWHDNNLKEVYERIEAFKEKAVILKGMSTEMIKQIPDDSLIFAYIDGDHSYDGCYNDLTGIFPKVKVGGIISCHDIKNMEYGVSDALRKCLLWNEKDYWQEDLHYTEEDGDDMMVSVWFIKK